MRPETFARACRAREPVRWPCEASRQLTIAKNLEALALVFVWLVVTTASGPTLAGDHIRIGARATITTGWPGCISEADFIQLNGFADSGDTYGFLKFSNDKRATGECIVLPAGTKVWIENISEQKHVCVRFIDGEGERTCYWVETNHIRVTP